MPTPTKPTYTHGSTGTKPPVSRDFENQDPLDANEFDYFVNTTFEDIKDIIDFLDLLDSDGDGTVDAADSATDATNVTATYKNNDIDSNGDGIVDEADISDQTRRFEVRTNDPSNPSDGQVWIRSDL